MIRSRFAVTRLIAIPYALLFTLYVLVLGGGSAWLYVQVKAAETKILIANLNNAITPLKDKLSNTDALQAFENDAAWLLKDVGTLYEQVAPLNNISIKTKRHGYQLSRSAPNPFQAKAASPLSFAQAASLPSETASDRLHSGESPAFLIGFDLSSDGEPAVLLEFAFDRAMLLNNLDHQMQAIIQAIWLFGMVGVASIFIALVITIVAMRTTRNIESHFQGIYQRAAITESAAQLVHDLRNHLAALRNNVKALLVTPDQISEIAEDMDKDIVNLNDSLTSFLDLTRQRKDKFEVTDVSKLIYDAAKVAAPELERHNLDLEINVPDDLASPEWQESAVRDAMINLLVNAAQSGQCDGVIRVSAAQDGDRIRITVEDKGRGIPQKQQNRIFNAFFTTRDEGNGLGLAIVRRIVLNHQGRIRVESQVGVGTTFVLMLPLKQKEAPKWWSRFKKTSQI